MSNVFGGGGKNRDIQEIVKNLTSSGICNESVAGSTMGEMDIKNMSDRVAQAVLENYAPCIDSRMEWLIQEDAQNAAQMFINNVAEHNDIIKNLDESAILPNFMSLTTSIATTMRSPYEAILHRLFDTHVLDKQTVDIEEVIPTIFAPGSTDEEVLVDALAPYAKVPFVDRTEIMVDTMVAGIEPDVKNLELLKGKNPLFTINRDARISKIDAEVDGEVIPQENITFMRGSVPYFEARDCTLNCIFLLKKADGTVVTADVTARMDFKRGIMEYLRADPCVKKVYFYATVSHEEHTHPIRMGYKNSFQQYVIPTRPHIEVSMPQETRTDITNSIQHFASTDIITFMTEEITTISTRLEDQRLKKCLDAGHEYEAEFPFDAPANFAHGNLEWIKKEFIPHLDQCALKMKNWWNITDCHFRVGVSPYILRILDTDYTMDKAMTEESRGSGVINYSIGIKTSTAVFYFISAQNFADDKMQMCMLPNNFKMTPVRTYNYFKYSSFLTDQLRRHDNAVHPAIVYTERNMPIVFTAVSAIVTIGGMPTMKEKGPRYIKRVV